MNKQLLLTAGTLLGLLIVGCGPKATLIHEGRFVGQEADLPVQTANLQQLINDAKDGSVVQVPFGRYVLSTSLTITGRNNLHVAFVPGTQIRVGNTDDAVIVIDDCKNVKISGVRARHVKPLTEYSCHGAVVSVNKSDASIENCELNGCGAVGVSASESSLRVLHCHIHHNTFSAMYLSSCGDVSVIGCIIENNANTLQVESSKGEIMWSDNVVQNNGGYWQKPVKPGLRPDTEADLAPVTKK